MKINIIYICSLLLDEHLYYADPYERRGTLDGGLRRLDVKFAEVDSEDLC